MGRPARLVHHRGVEGVLGPDGRGDRFRGHPVVRGCAFDLGSHLRVGKIQENLATG
jgi:hypothetical protein